MRGKRQLVCQLTGRMDGQAETAQTGVKDGQAGTAQTGEF